MPTPPPHVIPRARAIPRAAARRTARLPARLAALALGLALVAPRAPLAAQSSAVNPPDVGAAGVDAGVAARVRALVDDFGARRPFAGVVLVARDREVVARRAWGDADVAAGRPVTADTRFELGSISKWVASVVVLALADRGLVALDAPLTTYLPDFRRDTGARLTLDHLLTHTSGLPNAVVAALRADSTLARASLSSAEAVARYAGGDLQFAPGSRFDYAHVNWLVVRAVVERVTGEPWDAVVRATLWTPLGLSGSGTFVGDFSRLPGSALGYAALQPAVRRVVPVPDFMAAAGGAYATADDLLALLHGVYAGPVLSPGARAALSRVRVPAEGYAYGSRVRTLPLPGGERTVAWHSGSNGAYRALAARDLADGWTVIVLGNASADQGAMGALAQEVLRAAHP